MVEYYTQCYIVVATLTELGCGTIEDANAAVKNLYKNCQNDNDKTKTFHDFARRCVDRYLNPTALSNLLSSEVSGSIEDLKSQHYKCAHCDEYLNFDTAHGHRCESSLSISDGIYDFSKQSLFRGMMLSVLEDAIRENDGDRIELVMKLFLPILHHRQHDNYAHTVLRFLVYTKVVASPYERDRLLYNMTCNWRKQRGHCTPIDWRLERCNDFLKQDLKSLGANLTQKNALAMSHTLKATMEVVESIESDLSGERESKYRRSWSHSLLEDFPKVIKLLTDANLFTFVSDRSPYQAFEFSSASIYDKINRDKLAQWLKASLKRFDERRAVDSRHVL
jgi:hypothetical protein